VNLKADAFLKGLIIGLEQHMEEHREAIADVFLIQNDRQAEQCRQAAAHHQVQNVSAGHEEHQRSDDGKHQERTQVRLNGHEERGNTQQHDEWNEAFLKCGDCRFALLEPGGQVEHHRNFQKFRRLNGKSHQLNPAACRTVLVANTRQEQHHEQDEVQQEQRARVAFPEMIRNGCRCTHDAQCGNHVHEAAPQIEGVRGHCGLGQRQLVTLVHAHAADHGQTKEGQTQRDAEEEKVRTTEHGPPSYSDRQLVVLVDIFVFRRRLRLACVRAPIHPHYHRHVCLCLGFGMGSTAVPYRTHCRRRNVRRTAVIA
jgi:hypothetical protein